MKNKSLPDKWFILPILILGVYFIIRLIDHTKLLSQFPFDYVNDLSSYMAQLHFLKECGFLNYCPYWYNGFINFSFSPPGWYFFTLPLYLIFNDVKIATYISEIVIFMLIFIVIYFGCKYYNISKIKSVAFFLFLFANAIVIGGFIKSGRPHELFGWLNFLIVLFLTLKYKDKEVDKKFFLTIPFLAIIIITYQAIAIFTAVYLLGILITGKKLKEFFIITSSGIISLLLSSFWWVPLIKNLHKGSFFYYNEGSWILRFDSQYILTSLAAIIIPLLMLVLFYYYWKSSNKSKKELLFFLPIIILAILMLTRISTLVPVIKDIFPDPYLILLIIFSIFFFLKTDIKIYNKNIIKTIPILLLIASILSVGINIIKTPYFVENSELDKEILDTLNYVDRSFFMIGGFPPSSYEKAYYSYASIYFNLSTPNGWYPELASESYLESIKKLPEFYNKKDCSNLKLEVKNFNITDLVVYKDGCEFIKKCGFKEKIKKENICLYGI